MLVLVELEEQPKAELLQRLVAGRLTAIATLTNRVPKTSIIVLTILLYVFCIRCTWRDIFLLSHFMRFVKMPLYFVRLYTIRK